MNRQTVLVSYRIRDELEREFPGVSYPELYLLASGGDRRAQYGLGLWYQRTVKGKQLSDAHREAAVWYGKAAESAHPRALYRLGLLYEHGLGGLTQSDEEAEGLIRRAIKQADPGLIEVLQLEAGEGEPDALNALGCLYYFGYGVELNYDRTLALWSQAADKGSPRGFYHLSCAYHSGVGTEANNQLSIAYCRIAAALGMGVAAHRMGLRYFHGNDVPIDHELACRYFRMGCKAGYGLSMTALMFCLSTGSQALKFQ